MANGTGEERAPQEAVGAAASRNSSGGWPAAGFATITLTGARPVPGLDDLTVTGFGFTIGGLALMLVAVALGGLSFRPGPEAIGLLIALGTGPTAVAYTLYFRGLRAAAASTGALLTLLEPLTGAVLAALILGQRLSPTGIAGAAVLATAVVIAVMDADRGEPAKQESGTLQGLLSRLPGRLPKFRCRTLRRGARHWQEGLRSCLTQ